MSEIKVKTRKLGPGRKSIQDKKKPVTVYIKESIIGKHGGLEELRLKILEEFDR